MKAKDGMELQERKARARARVTRAPQKAKASRSQSPRMARENRKRALTRARAEQMTDPREKEKVIDSATFVANHGHYARDCWQGGQQVRAVAQNAAQQSQDSMVSYQTVVQGSPSSSKTGNVTHLTSVSNQVPQAQQSAVQSGQHRVARIVENTSEDLVFGLRVSTGFGGNMCVVHHFIGDADEDTLTVSGMVRAVVEEVEDDESAQMVLLDSGADYSVFPSSLIEAGSPVAGQTAKLCDAQGRDIPVEGARCVEIRLGTTSGKTMILKEKVAISSKVNQPILCYGRLMEQGFGINATEQSLVHHGSNTSVPIHMQNRSMAIVGQVRMISAVDGGVIPCAVQCVQSVQRSVRI